MPISVVWQQLSGLEPVNLRAAAANEVRRTRKLPSFIRDAGTGAGAIPPKGLLGALPGDAYEVRQRYADGRPWRLSSRGRLTSPASLAGTRLGSIVAVSRLASRCRVSTPLAVDGSVRAPLSGISGATSVGSSAM